MLGAIFETHVLGQIVRHFANQGRRREIYFYRDHPGALIWLQRCGAPVPAQGARISQGGRTPFCATFGVRRRARRGHHHRRGDHHVRIVNVVIVKARIQSGNYGVLDRALTYSVQRIENDLTKSGNRDARFMIVTDEGRVGKMRKTTRRVQRFNFIPSQYAPYSYRREIKLLIEDPLPKSSAESHSIQLADLVSYVIKLHVSMQLGGSPPTRMPPEVTVSKISEWMDRLLPSLNVDASAADPFGIVCYPQ
jgi:hypothetical protein